MEQNKNQSARQRNERRTFVYTFNSQRDLIAFFQNLIPKKKILEVIADAEKDFVIRKGVSDNETKLQFIKKCEYKLSRMVKEKGIRS